MVYGTLEQVCDTIYKRQHDKYDNVIAVSGTEGVGKSVFMQQAWEYLQKKNNIESKYDDIIFRNNSQEIKEKYHASPMYTTWWWDEAHQILYKQKWHSNDQIEINTFFSALRQDHYFNTFLGIPRFIDLNEYFRNHRIKFWIEIVDRGMGVVFSTLKSCPSTTDPWMLKKMESAWSEKTNNTLEVDMDIEDKLDVMENVSTYVGTFTFPDVDSDKRKLYDQAKQAFMDRYATEEEETELSRQPNKRAETIRLLVYYLNKKMGLTLTEICDDVLYGSICRKTLYCMINKVDNDNSRLVKVYERNKHKMKMLADASYSRD